MASDDSIVATLNDRSSGRRLVWTGIGLAMLAIALVVLQYGVGLLMVPWYVPLLTTLGAGMLFWSLMKRRSVVRVLAFGMVAVLAGLEWQFLLSSSRLPSYDGPAQVGQAIPAFQSKLADGRPFTEQNLREGVQSVLVFFRGRW